MRHQSMQPPAPRRSRLLAVLAMAVASIGCIHAALAARTESAAPPPACTQWSTWLMCDVSWYQLLANPGTYEGKIVSVQGYLVSDFGDLLLYPDETSYRGGKETESLVLARPFHIPATVIDRLGTGKGVYPVTVLGRFATVPRDPRLEIRRGGELREIKKILFMPKVPSGTPLDMRGISVDGRAATSGHAPKNSGP